ncbi:hypothetical protein MTO96_025963 [Rhipicephalus appendiculatus]
MGTSISAQINENSPYVAAVNRMGEIFVERLTRPLLQIDFLYQLTASGREFGKCIDVIHSFARKVIEERKEELEKEVNEGTLKLDSCSESEFGVKRRRPFLDLLILEHLKDDKYITKEDMREEVDTFLFAGHDTTAIGISWALFLIGHHPEEQQNIHEELDQIFGDDKERYVSFEDLRQMKYLECAIKEAQRIYPSVPIISRQCEEPFEIGQKFALAEEKIVIGNILRHFTIKSLDQRDQVEIGCEMVLRPRVLFATICGMHAQFQRYGRHLTYLGFTPLLFVYKAEYVEVIEERKKVLEKEVNEGSLKLDSSSETVYGANRRRPFLDLLILEHLKNDKHITKEDMREEVDTFMFEVS